MRIKLFDFLKKSWRPAVSLVVFLAVWEIISRLELLNPILLSSPLKILESGLRMVLSGVFLAHFLSSVWILMVGFVLALVVGIFAGLLIGSSKKWHEFAKPHIFVLGSLPMVAIIPLIIIWFGIGVFSKVLVVFLMALIPVLLNSIAGVKNTDPELMVMAESFKAGSFFILKNVIFYNSLPFIFSGARLAIGRSIVGLVAADFFGYGKGLGYLITYYGSTFQIGKAFFVIFVLILLTFILAAAVSFLERKIIKWA